MTNSNPSLPPPLAQTPRFIPKKLSIAFLVISFIGFLDATYLTAKHYLGTPLPCSFFTGCDTVTKSVYSTIGPIPVALLGALYYFTLFALAAGFFGFGARKMLLLAARLTPIGILASLWFLILQLFIIKTT